MLTRYIIVLFFLLSMRKFGIDGLIFNVSDYGGFPDDNLDDSNATSIAVYMANLNGPNNIVRFASGTYDFSTSVYVVYVNNLTIMGQGMESTKLVGHFQSSVFMCVRSSGVKFTMFAIDYDPLPFTAGYVVASTGTYIDVQVVPPHRADVNMKVSTILRYDPVNRRPAFGSRTYEMYQTPPANRNTTLVGNNTLRIPIAFGTPLVVGDAIIARYVLTLHAFYVQEAPDLTLQSITIYTAWYMGIYGLRAPRVNIIDYHVKSANGRWMSTAADCMHFADSRQSIKIKDCTCEEQGDDGLNIHAYYFQIIQILNQTSFVVKTYNWLETMNVGNGTLMEFNRNNTPFSVYTTAVLRYHTPVSADSQLYVFNTSVNVSVGDWVCVAETPVVTIENLTVANNRARGVLLQSRNVYMTRSLFNRTSGPAVLFHPSLYWYESSGTQNAILEFNAYINCNEGIVSEKGIISFLPYPTQIVPVMFDVIIRSSVFVYNQNSQYMIQSANVDGLLISGNHITTNMSAAPVLLCNTRNISATNNTFLNNQSIVSQFFAYDSTSPCSTNWTNSIDLPRSGFNASFLPPVIATNDGVIMQTSATTTTTTTSTTATTSTTTTTTTTRTSTTATSGTTAATSTTTTSGTTATTSTTATTTTTSGIITTTITTGITTTNTVTTSTQGNSTHSTTGNHTSSTTTFMSTTNGNNFVSSSRNCGERMALFSVSSCGMNLIILLFEIHLIQWYS